MTRKKHDQYAKQFVAGILEPQGETHINYEIPPGEAHHADIYFVPAPDADFQRLGLLGKIATKACLIEPFRNQPTKMEVQSCLLKLFTLRNELSNQAERSNESEKESLKEEELPLMWILSTSMSDTLLNFFDAKPKPRWYKGIYFCPVGIRTAIVSINQLPVIPETLLLRLLGKGETQKQAIEEIRTFPEDDALRQHIEGLLYRWRIYVEAQKTLTEDDKGLLMNFSEIYEEHQEKILLQGIQQGVQQGIKRGQEIIVENLLKLRFGKMDKTLSSVIKRLLQLPPQESSRLILQSSREELLAKLS
jgi:hypothetical protein